MRIILIIHFILIVYLLTMTFCSKSDKEDLSLSQKEYLELGLPEYNRVWTQDDYINSFIELNKLKLTNPFSLPRKNSKKSGVYFDRMLSDENFSFLYSDTLSLSEKAYQIQYYSSIQNELIRLYTNVLNRDQYYHEELVELYIFGLNVTQKKLDLANKIMNSEDERDKRMQYGLYSVQLGYLEMVLYILENHNISASYNKKDLERLSGEVSESIKNNKEWMKPNDAERLKQKLQIVADNTPSEIARNNYLELIENW